MFQIESQDDPLFKFRVYRTRNLFTTTVVIQEYDHLNQRFKTNASRDFRNSEQADAAYRSQCTLLTLCAKSRGNRYRITENEHVTNPQLTLEIAA